MNKNEYIAEIARLTKRVKKIYLNEERSYHNLLVYLSAKIARLNHCLKCARNIECDHAGEMTDCLHYYPKEPVPEAALDRAIARLGEGDEYDEERAASLWLSEWSPRVPTKEPAPIAPNHENRLTCSACGHEVDMLSHDKCASCLDDELAETTAKLHELQNAVLKHEKPAPIAEKKEKRNYE